MGGNALKLKGLDPQRIKDADLPEVIQKISQVLLDNKIFKWVAPVKYYKTKEDHGDLDLVGELYPKKDNPCLPWQLEVKTLLNSKEIHWNNPVASLEYQGHQIDITGRHNYEKAKAHLEFSHYSPLGNILGRLIKKTGAKWGIDGLEYQIKDTETPESQVLKTVPLSRDIEGVLKLCGLDPDTWHKGFECQTDIFEYACQSPLFNKKIFHLENLNHAHRKRDRTRPDYHQWLSHIKDPSILDKINWVLKESPEEYKTRKEAYQKIIDKEFPDSHLLIKIQEERIYNNFIKSQKKEKFNGELISLWTKLKGVELGNLLKEFKSHHNLNSQDSLIHWIINNDKATIKKTLLDYKNLLKDKLKDIE